MRISDWSSDVCSSDLITHAVNEFFIKFLVALSVVLLVTLLTLGLRVGLIVAAAVPLTLGVTFIAMLLTGRNIDLISLGELLLSLGLLVDDAISAIDIIYVSMQPCVGRLAAQPAAWRPPAAPMLSRDLVTVSG